MFKKNTKTILISLVIILLVVVGAYTLKNQDNNKKELSGNEHEEVSEVNNKKENKENLQNKENIDVSPEEQGALSTYLENNISELSPEEAVLGGTFYVADVSFPEDNLAIVNYEDGHIALTAKVNYNYDNEEVTINSFELIESNDIGEVESNEEVEGVSVEEQGIVNTYIENNISNLSPEEAVLGGTFQVRSVSFPEEGIAIVNYEDDNSNLTAKADYSINNNDEVEINYFKLITDSSTVERNGSNYDNICINMCGDEVCQEMVCMGEGCPCAETAQSCSADCF
jgi:cell division protein FtsL